MPERRMPGATFRVSGFASGFACLVLHAKGMPSRMNTKLQADGKGSVAAKTCHRPTEIGCAIDAHRNSRAALTQLGAVEPSRHQGIALKSVVR